MRGLDENLYLRYDDKLNTRVFAYVWLSRALTYIAAQVRVAQSTG
jgi:hypothetical protein